MGMASEETGRWSRKQGRGPWEGRLWFRRATAGPFLPHPPSRQMWWLPEQRYLRQPWEECALLREGSVTRYQGAISQLVKEVPRLQVGRLGEQQEGRRPRTEPPEVTSLGSRG